MKICILSHTFPRFHGDTPAPFMENLANALAGEGHEIFVLLPYDKKFKTNAKRSYKLVTYRYTFLDSFHILGYSREFDYGKNLRLATYVLGPFLILFGVIALIRVVARKKIDVISSHWIIPSGFIAAVATLFTRTPYTVSIPGSDIYLGGKNFLFRAMTAFAANRASFVLSDNAAFMNQLLALGIKPKRRKIIVYGADAGKFVPTKKDLKVLKSFDLDSSQPIILAVGRLVPKKGFIYLVKAMPLVLKHFPRAKLVIVGDGEQRAPITEEINKLNISSSVVLAGTINYNDLPKYYNLGDVFVMPSIRDEQGNIDASPVAMMEAMACGTPVVSTKFSGSRELVVEGKTGFLVKEKDSPAISRAVVKLLSIDRTKMKRYVREMAVNSVSTTSVAKKYTEIFKTAKSS